MLEACGPNNTAEGFRKEGKGTTNVPPPPAAATPARTQVSRCGGVYTEHADPPKVAPLSQVLRGDCPRRGGQAGQHLGGGQRAKAVGGQRGQTQAWEEARTMRRLSCGGAVSNSDRAAGNTASQPGRPTPPPHSEDPWPHPHAPLE